MPLFVASSNGRPAAADTQGTPPRNWLQWDRSHGF